MNRSVYWPLLGAVLLFSLRGTAQYKSPFSLYPEVCSQGDTVRVVYRPKLAGHNDSAGVRASVYLYRNFEWEGHDLVIKKTDSGWVTPYVIPSGTAMMAFHFLIGDSVDKGGRIPYAGLVHERPGKMADGAYMEWGLFRNKQKTGMVSDIVPAISVIGGMSWRSSSGSLLFNTWIIFTSIIACILSGWSTLLLRLRKRWGSLR